MIVLDWNSFNPLEFFAALLVATVLWLWEMSLKPRVVAEVGSTSQILDGKARTLNLKVKNLKNEGVFFFKNRTATQIKIVLHFLDYPSRVEFNQIVARWNDSREPVTPDYKEVDIGLALTNPREVLVPGEESEISVVIRTRENKSSFPFNNHSYIYSAVNYCKPEWAIADDKYIVQVEFRSAELQQVVGEFVVLNKGSVDLFKMQKV